MELASHLTLKQGDYPGLSGRPDAITRALMCGRRRRKRDRERLEDATLLAVGMEDGPQAGG